MLARFSAFRRALYARMEEISFRSSMAVLAVLGGVVAIATVVATATVLMNQGSGPGQPTAFSPSARFSALPTATLTTPAARPTKPAPAPPKPARKPASAKTSPAAEAPSRTGPVSPPRTRAPEPRVSPVVSRAAWWRSHGAEAPAGFGGASYGGAGYGMGGFGVRGGGRP